MANVNKIIRDIYNLYLNEAVLSLILIIKFVVISYIINPDIYGYYGYLLALASLYATTSNLSLNSGVNYYYSKKNINLKTSIGIGFIVSFIASFLLILILISNHYFNFIININNELLLLLVVLVFINILSRYVRLIIINLSDKKKYFFYNIGSELIFLFLIIFFQNSLTVKNLLYIQIFSSFTVNIFYSTKFYLYKQNFFLKKKLRKIIKYSFKNYLIAFTEILNDRSNILIISIYFNSYILGIYLFSEQIFNFLVNRITKLAPFYINNLIKYEASNFNFKNYFIYINSIYLIIFPILLIIIILLFNFVFSKVYFEGLYLSICFIFISFFKIHNFFFRVYLLSKNDHLNYLLISIFKILILISLNLYILKYYSFYFIAFSIFISEFFMYFFLIQNLNKKNNIILKEMFEFNFEQTFIMVKKLILNKK